jgi:hypothetical protein
MARSKYAKLAVGPNVDNNRNASATKRGPGRYHSVGARKNSPIKSKGAPRGFTLHKASEERKERRNMIKTYGRRQGLKAIKYWRSGTPFFDIAAEEPVEA